VNSREKLIAPSLLANWRESQRQAGKKLVVTNGCFDLLHVGHVTYLEQASALGDLLLVGVNSDSAVHELKGANRPVNCESDRATVLAALASVDAVSIFGEKSAANFLAVARPDIYVKGGDYTLESINQAERRVVEQAGGRIVIVPLVPGKSTTSTLAKIARL
jgi:rfaE bifunctional protein nucleotidyltransferase chain/domain